jgi:signal transduction histidine kinase
MTEGMGGGSDVPTLQERLCRVDTMMSLAEEARRVCAEGYAAALANHDPEDARRVTGSLARIELTAGHPGKAAALLDRALADDGVDLPQRWLAQMHLLRAQVRAQRGDPAGALADMNAYADWLGDDRVARNVAQVGIIRLRFDRAVREQELGRLRAEAAAARIAASERTLTLNLVIVGTALLLAAVFGTVWGTRRRRDALRLAQAAQERLAAMSQVTGGIAHDFNNQLTVMQHAVWMLLQRADLAGNAEVRELLRGIQQSSRDCAHITSQMLSFSRQQNLQPEAIALGPWLRRHLLLFQELAGNAVSVQLKVGEPDPVAWADPRLLTAALLNLVANARDATAGPGSITLGAEAEGPGAVRVTVEDSGCGMTPAVAARATEPFFTTKDVGRGSGLGLSMVAGFATQSGGSLQLSSEPGRGTRVSLRLPAYQGAGL